MTSVYDYMRKDIKERIASWTDKIMAGQLDNERYKFMSGEVAGMKYAIDLINLTERLDDTSDEEFGGK